MRAYRVPCLNLAPKPKHNLSIWNPSDYWRLLYWVFFFPQALRKYVVTSGDGLSEQNSTQREVIFQGIILTLIFVLVFVAIISAWKNYPHNDFIGILSGMVLGMASGMASGAGWGVGLVMANGLRWRVALGIALGVMWRLGVISVLLVGLTSVTGNRIDISAYQSYLETYLEMGGLGIAVGLAWAVAWRVASRAVLGAPSSMVSGMTSGVASGFTWAMVVGWTLGWKWGLMWVGALLWAIFRPEDWLLGWLCITWKPHSRDWLFLHVTPFRLNYLSRLLTEWLRGDWETGLHNANQILTYTLQFRSVVRALNQVLAETPPNQIISCVAQVVDKLDDGNLLRFVSYSLGRAKTSHFGKGYWWFRVVAVLWFTQLKWRKSKPVASYESAVTATVAGFWYLHKLEPAHAAQAFRQVRNLTYGEEMLALAQTLTSFYHAQDLNAIAKLSTVIIPPEPVLRRATWRTIKNLRWVIEEAQVLQNSESASMRSFAHGRALGELKTIINKSDTLSHPERHLIIKIAQNWQEALLQIADELQTDTGGFSLAAGFWHLHEKELDKAIEVFALSRSMPNGEEMFALTQTLRHFYSAQDLASIANLPVSVFPQEHTIILSRPQTWSAIKHLNQVIENVHVVQYSISSSIRSFAYNRALGELKAILNQAGNLPQPEREIIVDITSNWQELLLQVASEVGKLTISKPVSNPYIVGDPVEGKLFVGREDVIRQLEELWLNKQQLQSVVLYGHRRMGKTSILRNIAHCFSSSAQVVYVNLQRLGAITHGTGEVLMAISDEIAAVVNIPPPDDQELLNLPQRTFERYLKQVVEVSDQKGLIIALDEFETIEELIQAGQITTGLMSFLRGLLQMSPQVAFAFAGLHTLDEMTADYFQPFFASVISIHVSFLNLSGTKQILANPSDDFPLDYTSEALEHIHVLTAGQPYLVQRVGFQLVRRYNDQVFERGGSRKPVFTLEDVDQVINDPEFFQKGRYYFEGVWMQAAQGAKGQQVIIQALAPHAQGLSYEQLATATNLDIVILNEALKTLIHHDVIVATDSGVRIIVELFRRWVWEHTGKVNKSEK